MTIQAFIVALIGLVILCIGLAGLISPATLVAFAGNSRSPRGFAVASGVRLVFGLALWLAAAESRAVGTLYALGALSFVAGLSLPLLGRARFYALIDWWAARPHGVVRISAAVGASLGAFSIWAVMP